MDKYALLSASQWENNMEKLQMAEQVPSNLLHESRKYKFGLDGKYYFTTSQYNFFEYDDSPRGTKPTEEYKDGISHRMVVRNENGQIVAMRLSRIFKLRQGFEVNSRIIVKERGKGMAKWVDGAFGASLEDLADQLGEPIIWKVYNENLETLNFLKERPNADPKAIMKLEEEQQRWQALYGHEGKLGFKEGKKVFNPRGISKVTAETKASITKTTK